jgi:RimJ/RimL family protein N-acetyltransferase
MLELRPARHEDSRLLLDWRNDPNVRAASFSTQEISRESHDAWLARKLEDPDCALLIVEMDGNPLGYVRLDRLNRDEAEISIALAPEARGRGIGRDALRLATSSAARSLGVKTVRARVRGANSASLTAFRAAGFSTAGGNEEVIDLRLFL